MVEDTAHPMVEAMVEATAEAMEEDMG